MAEGEPKPIGPQPGAQERFLATPADIAIYGGAAGGGKTWALLMEPLRHIHNSDFGAVIFRRTTVQIRNEGGLWDESGRLYPLIGADIKEQGREWRFPSGAAISFAHLEHEKDIYGWQGSQVPLICFDELTHFTEKQFWYMLSRNRSMCGVRPYVRATCNPDSESWVAKFIKWWINPETGLATQERSGVLRWFVRLNDKLIWADTPDELIEKYPEIPPKSLTFVPAKLSDNPALTSADPGYLANLMAQTTVERERLLGGNWKIRPAAGLLFQRTWCKVVKVAPADLQAIRGWDLAATPKTESNDPDATCGTKIARDRQTGRFIVLDHKRKLDGPMQIKRLIVNTASQDGVEVAIELPQDPGQAGKAQFNDLAIALAGYTVRGKPVTGDKATRFGPFSAQAEAGNVDVLEGDWNEDWFSALEAFPEAAHDDDADSTSQAFNGFLDIVNSQGLLDLIRREAAAKTEPEPPPITYAQGSVEWMQANGIG